MSPGSTFTTSQKDQSQLPLSRKSNTPRSFLVRGYAIRCSRAHPRTSDLLAGNSWHGSILAVCWIKVIPNHSEQRIGFSCHSSRPIQLEEVSPVRDKHLLLPMPASAFVPGPSGRRASVQQSVPGTQRSPRGPRAAGVGQNVSSPGLSPTAATFSSTASPYTGYIPVSVSMAPPPLPNPRPFTLEPQEHTQLQQLLSRHLSGSDTEYWTTDSLSPVSSSSTGSFSQSFTSISPHSNYGVVGSPPTQAQAMPYAGAATNTMHPTYRPAPSASRSAPQPQRKKMDKKEPEAEDEQSPEKEKGKRKGPGPVIADGSGDEWPT